MKKNWNQLYDALGDFQELLEKVIPEIPQSKHFKGRTTGLKKLWAIVQKKANEFDQLIPEVKPVPVNSPFDHEDFLVEWQNWKEYLLEQHSIPMGSRMEVKALKHLADISKSDHKKAIPILELAMRTGYKSFFVPNKKADPGKEISTEEIEY